MSKGMLLFFVFLPTSVSYRLQQEMVVNLIIRPISVVMALVLQRNWHKTLYPSSIPWNPLCLSGFQRLMGTIPPFITLHFYKDLSLKTSII